MSRRVLVLLLALLALVGAAGSKCQRGVDSDRPPSERQVDPATARTAVILVTRATGPYTITVVARDESGGTDRTGPAPVAGGEYRQTVEYNSGLRIEITVEVVGSPSDRFACEISDGLYNVDRDSGRGTVLCQLVTAQ